LMTGPGSYVVVLVPGPVMVLESLKNVVDRL